MKNQQKIERFLNRINQDEDFLIEEILIGLIERGLINDTEWEIKLQSGDRRDKDKDAERFHVEKEKVCFEVTRDGLFEKLPETLFLKSYYEKIPLSKRNPEKERVDSKSFFQILENQYYHAKLNFHKCKRDLLTGSLEELFIYWGFSDSLSNEQKIRLLSAIPIIKYYKKNLENLSMLLEFILNIPVKLEYKKSDSTNFSNDFTSSLGRNSTLGRDFIVSGVFNDCISKIHVIIGEVNKKTLIHLHTEKFKIQLKFICEFLFPAECSMSYEVLLIKEERNFVESDEYQFLGHSTYI